MASSKPKPPDTVLGRKRVRGRRRRKRQADKRQASLWARLIELHGSEEAAHDALVDRPRDDVIDSNGNGGAS